MTTLGKAYFIKVFEIDDASKTAKGTSVRSLLQFSDNEDITACIAFRDFNDENISILMSTKKGILKRTRLCLLKNARTKGVKAIELDEGDELDFCVFSNSDEDEALIASKSGKGLRFKVSQVRVMGRTAHGVKGLKLANENDCIVGLVIVDKSKMALTITSDGKGKQVDYDTFNAHGRSSKGNILCKFKSPDEYLAACVSVDSEKEDLMCITEMGQTIRTSVSEISKQGRTAMGVKVFTLRKANDRIVSVAVLDKDEESTAESTTENN